MKKILTALVIVTSLIACKSSDKKTVANITPLTQEEKDKASNDTANFTTIQWLDSTTMDLGKLKKDNKVELTFRFKNSGTKNLIIENQIKGEVLNCSSDVECCAVFLNEQ